ncbi:AraC family transcriptional regulator [Photobacterium angustum]|uniref:AraC family transcriptional regulator n=1 Tax=Photobacterium angustum TaxID=661 RepID=A0ABX5H651_PHOAN|nr:helix-turn-helix transcriptional regulator [Photobacterium angustum]KJG39772.1 AraC family transcriptional regulator [Photobacterium angustum]PSX11367.1 AraC family transcriptional regulator [Photobacterium angustum]
MLAIPLPFVAALLLFMIGILLRYRYLQNSQKPFWFTILCASMITVVGLRWTLDIAFFRFLQPILGAIIPVTAWFCFAEAHRNKANTYWHWLGPVIVLVSSFMYQNIWSGSVDVLLISLYLGYGYLLLKSSFNIPEQVRLTDVSKVLIAERVTGLLLLFSALVDGVLSFDILVFNAQHINLILTIGYLFFIPAIVIGVIVVSLSMPSAKEYHQPDLLTPILHGSLEEADAPLTSFESDSDEERDKENAYIVAKFDAIMRDHQIFKDPDLSLNKLARKLSIPARKISSAVNQTYNENISKVINTYRIEHAKTLLKQSDGTITDIFLNSGFQTKSNFNREFSRITGQTPSEFRSSRMC